MNAEAQHRFFLCKVWRIVLYCVKNGGKLVSEEYRNDCGRCLARAETVVVACVCDRYTQQYLIVVDRLYDRTEEEQELRILVRGLAGREQIYAGICRERPVVVLARAVDSLERLFVQQADESVTLCDLLHHLHGELIVVGRLVCHTVDGCKLVLRGRGLVVLGLCEHAELPQLLVELGHERLDSRLYRAEIVVVKLLTLECAGAVERSAGKDKIGTSVVHFLVDEEVFLLGSCRGEYACGIRSEQTDNAQSLSAERLHRAH